MNSDQTHANGTGSGRQWSDLGWWHRTALLLGRSPESPTEARVMLGQSRQLRRRRPLTAAVGAAGATIVWLALSMLLGGADEQSSSAWVVSALAFGVVFFVTNVWLSGRQADRLEERANDLLARSDGPGPPDSDGH